MREKLKKEETRDKVLKKLGFKALTNCFSYILSNKNYNTYLSSQIKVPDLLGAFTKKGSLSEAFNFIRQTSEEVFKSSFKGYLGLKLSFKRKTLINKGCIHSRPFRIGDHWWFLTVSPEPIDHSYFRIFLEYFKPVNPENFNLHHLKAIYNLDSPDNVSGEEGNVELDITSLFSLGSKLKSLKGTSGEARTPELILNSDCLKLLSSCVLPQIIYLRAVCIDLHHEPKAKRSYENGKHLLAICLEGEAAEVGEMPLPESKELVSVEVGLESHSFLSAAYTDILYAALEGCKRPKKLDISEFTGNSEHEILALVKLFRYIHNGSEQDAALIISDYGRR